MLYQPKRLGADALPFSHLTIMLAGADGQRKNEQCGPQGAAAFRTAMQANGKSPAEQNGAAGIQARLHFLSSHPLRFCVSLVAERPKNCSPASIV